MIFLYFFTFFEFIGLYFLVGLYKNHVLFRIPIRNKPSGVFYLFEHLNFDNNDWEAWNFTLSAVNLIISFLRLICRLYIQILDPNEDTLCATQMEIHSPLIYHHLKSFKDLFIFLLKYFAFVLFSRYIDLLFKRKKLIWYISSKYASNLNK